MDFPRLVGIGGLGYHPDKPPAAWYWRSLFGDGFAPHIVIRCEHGNQATLGRAKHQIAADGTITPSLVWMRWDETAKAEVPGCCHISGARLLDWSAEDAALRATG